MMARELDLLRNKAFKEDDMKAIINHLTRKYEEKCAEVIILNHDKNEGKGCLTWNSFSFKIVLILNCDYHFRADAKADRYFDLSGCSLGRL